MLNWRASLGLLGRRGQIVIPALFVVPSLVLFIYLIYETAKLSKDKIRHQFALDTAAFVEMTNYSDFLNRTAYVNGAFPARVGYEAFNQIQPVDCIPEMCPSASYGKQLDYYQYLVTNGLLPTSSQCKDISSCSELNNPNVTDWGFSYEENGLAQKQNGSKSPERNSPDVSGSASTLWITDHGVAMTYYLPETTVFGANTLSSLYNLIFSLLGTVENSQIAVFQRFQSSHYFFSRAYTMNLPGERATAMRQFPILVPKSLTVSNIGGWWWVPANEPTAQQGVAPVSQLVLLTTVGGLDSSESIPRRDIEQPWDPGPASQNRFAVDLRGLLGQMPYVHCQVEVAGGEVWPGATPRYQVRVYP